MTRFFRSRWWLLPPLALAVLAALHTGLWRSASSALAQGFEDWAAQRRALGWVVQHGMPVRGGWPFAVTLMVPGIEIAGSPRTTPAELRWQAEALELRIALSEWEELRVGPRGRQLLALPGLELPFAADRLELALPLDGGATPREARLVAERLRMNTPLGGFEMRQGGLTLRARLSATEGEPAFSIDLDVTGLTLPPHAGPLGQRLERLALEGMLSGPLPLQRHPTQRAEAWRDAGGTIELRRAVLQWGPVGASLSATGTLDDALQPMGAGQLAVTGAAEAVDALLAVGWLSARAAGPARAIAALLSRRGEDGGPPVLELPITLTERRIGLARLPLARLPALQWPPPPELPDAARDPSLPRSD
ncbi:DUF2125 domain-containing protein [Rhodovarius sp.]|uniref:DUF2125 domain-containing protein n=1 Tax=Rhodovarius sp. TaxID=2972673 RepID=UPI003340812C